MLALRAAVPSPSSSASRNGACHEFGSTQVAKLPPHHSRSREAREESSHTAQAAARRLIASVGATGVECDISTDLYRSLRTRHTGKRGPPTLHSLREWTVHVAQIQHGLGWSTGPPTNGSLCAASATGWSVGRVGRAFGGIDRARCGAWTQFGRHRSDRLAQEQIQNETAPALQVRWGEPRPQCSA